MCWGRVLLSHVVAKRAGPEPGPKGIPSAAACTFNRSNQFSSPSNVQILGSAF